MIAVLSDVETDLISGLDTEALAAIAMKLSSPQLTWTSIGERIWDGLAPSSIKDKLAANHINEAYKIVKANPTMTAQLMLTTLFPLAVIGLMNIAIDVDERANVRVTANKELVRLGAGSQAKLAGMNERIDESALHTKDLLD